MSDDELRLSGLPNKYDADDFHDGSVDADGQAVNRPAHGARHATPGEVLFDGFQGSEDAGDFLGLDTELHFGQDIPVTPTAEPGLTSEPGSWTPQAVGLPQSVAGSSSSTSFDSGLGDERLPDGFDDGFEEPEAEAAAAGSSGFGKLAGFAFVLGLIGVSGYVFGPGLLERYQGKPKSEIATTSTPHPSRPTTPSPVTDDPEAGTDGDVAVVETGPELVPGAGATASPSAGADRPGSLRDLFSSDVFRLDLDPRAAVPSSSTGADALANRGGSKDPLVQGTDNGGRLPDIIVQAPSSVGSTGTSVAPISFPGVGTDDESERLVFDEQFFANIAWANDGPLDMIWQHTDAPMAALASPVRIAMPRVGSVRIEMKSGELFEGRLVAMGENRAWIQTEPGRMALDGSEIASITPIVGIQAQGSTSSPTVVRGDRVRVRTLGGVIYGHVLRQEGESLTLVTDAGARITLHEAEVEPIGSARAVLVQQ